MPIFIRLTLAIAAVLIGLVVLAFVLKLVLIAAVIAAFAIGGLVVVNAFRRKFGSTSRAQVMTLTARR
jgi:hypothetical protein